MLEIWATAKLLMIVPIIGIVLSLAANLNILFFKSFNSSLVIKSLFNISISFFLSAFIE